MAQSFINAAEAGATLRANLSPRQLDLEVLERFVDGTQYDGRIDWFAETDVPLWERKPCIVYPITATAIRSNVDLVLGDARFPAITSNPGEDDSATGGLGVEASKRVDRALAELCERVRFRSVARQALAHGQGARSVASIVGVRNGRPFVEHVRSRWCEKVERDATDRVTRLEIRYPYVEPQKQADGKWKLAVFIYRRAIDAQADTTFLPVPADPTGREPSDTVWQPDPARTIQHGLGFCPVHWYAHMRECSTVANIDGVAIHEHLLDEIRGLDFALSQRHRAALFTGDPQLYEIGVQPGYNPSGTGRTAIVPSTLNGGAPSPTNPVTGGYADTSRGAARIKSPGAVWQYDGDNVEVGYLVLPEGALKALDEHAADLRNKIAESLAVVILDPENMKITGQMSGRAIEMLRGRQYDRCDQIRDDFGANWIVPVLHLLLRVVLKTDAKIPAVDRVRGDLARFIADDASAPMLSLRWPTRYTMADPTEEASVVAAVVSAKTGGIITERMALEKIAPIFGVDNIDQALEQLTTEKAERMAQAQTGAPAKDKPPPKAPSEGATDDPNPNEDA